MTAFLVDRALKAPKRKQQHKTISGLCVWEYKFINLLILYLIILLKCGMQHCLEKAWDSCNRAFTPKISAHPSSETGKSSTEPTYASTHVGVHTGTYGFEMRTQEASTAFNHWESLRRQDLHFINRSGNILSAFFFILEDISIANESRRSLYMKEDLVKSVDIIPCQEICKISP